MNFGKTTLSQVVPYSKHEGAFYLYEDHATCVNEVVGLGVMVVDGHCTYLSDTDWILCDTYPDENRMQNPYLYHVPNNRRVPLAHLHSPEEYTGEWRCDLHPRSSPDGKLVTVDSPHGGNGRQIYLIDVSEIVGT